MSALVHPDVWLVEELGDGYAATYKHLRLIVSIAKELDGKSWLHASVSRQDCQMPAYEDLMELKRLCIGDHRTALQVFPSKDKHINIAGKTGLEVLHLWSCLDGDVTPDFARGGRTI